MHVKQNNLYISIIFLIHMRFINFFKLKLRKMLIIIRILPN